MTKPEEARDLPKTKEEYEHRYKENHRITGYGIEGVTNHFPCPFCAAPDWFVVRVIDFGAIGTTSPIKCEECSRSARFEVKRYAGGVEMSLVQVAGDDPQPWVSITRAVA